ncbi:phosphotransferase [Myxococcota bacterium]|nr:phosphotransferase [Myxococcota bacterium]MBU1410438.1 phosphotransferase [Myxococcota bacterium]MBU1511091.1 phosphotransferase [Myxococcota bacterium]
MHTQFLLEFPWKAITAAWPELACAIAEPLAGGLINKTVRMTARSGRRSVLQWLNPVFPGTVSDDVAAICRHLASRGFSTFSVLPTCDGASFLPHDNGSFRLLTHLEGDFLGQGDIGVAGQTLARFHRALADCTHVFSHHRNIHRPPFYAGRLREALETHADHPLHAGVAAVAREVLPRLHPDCDWNTLPSRIVHGDPKLENFWRTADGVTLLDLDTVGRHCILGELGDAGRALCRDNGAFSVVLFGTFFGSYLQRAPELAVTEVAAIPESIELIAHELTARFLIDALEEHYFGWDPTHFANRGEHNLHRARAEHAFAVSVHEYLDDCLKILVQERD